MTVLVQFFFYVCTYPSNGDIIVTKGFTSHWNVTFILLIKNTHAMYLYKNTYIILIYKYILRVDIMYLYISIWTTSGH